MSGWTFLLSGAVLAVTGAFYRSSRGALLRNHPFARWPPGRVALYLTVIGLIPEGVALMGSGIASFWHADELAVAIYVIGNLAVVVIWVWRPKWALPHWMPTDWL